MSDCLFELIGWHGALFERAHHAVTQLVLVEGLATAVGFDDARHDEFGRFEGREALIARQTLPATADLPTFPGKP